MVKCTLGGFDRLEFSCDGWMKYWIGLKPLFFLQGFIHPSKKAIWHDRSSPRMEDYNQDWVSTQTSTHNHTHHTRYTPPAFIFLFHI